MNERYFSQFRPKDYQTPRSIREAYGWDAPLFVEQAEESLSDFCGWLILIACFGLLVWFTYGWLE